MWWGAHKDFPDDVVTELMRIASDTVDTRENAQAGLSVCKPQNFGLNGLPESDYHPAALKFLKEKGIKIGTWGE